MIEMKISVCLPDEDVQFLDDYAQTHGMPSRSATIRRAIRLLQAFQLEDDYGEACQEWIDSGEEEIWGAVVSDGIIR
jgi:Arc/MetJ-type ribon-helix-helix transcriptional regulator